MNRRGDPSKPSRKDQHARRGSYTGVWTHETFQTPCVDPLCAVLLICMQASFCAPCTSYQLRRRALHNDMRNYICCQGAFPCSGRCGEQQCPELCLGTEVCCCFANSVVTTRWLIQDEMYISNTECDNCLMGFLICIEELACIFRCAGDLTGNPALEELGAILTCAADLSYCSICACYQTQHKLQLDARDEGRCTPPIFSPPPVEVMTGGAGYQAYPQQGYPTMYR